MGIRSDQAASPRRPSVLLATEGTYPYVLGGVSTWCHQLVSNLYDIEWTVLPITSGAETRTLRFSVPGRVRVLPGVRVWSETPAWRRQLRLTQRPIAHIDQPVRLARALFDWDADPLEAIRVLAEFRTRPGDLAVFSDPAAWRRTRGALAHLGKNQTEEAGGPIELDRWTAIEMFRTLGWVAATAAAPTPPVDVHLVTAAGWAALPAAVDRYLNGTPMVVAEHGVYVREAYLSAIRGSRPAGARWAVTRLARGLARLAYAAADRIAPVTSAHIPWELSLGADPRSVSPIVNGIAVPPGPPKPAPEVARAVSIGRIDPLKDIHTLLDVAAEVVRRVPEARFVHHGPVSPGQEAYARSCYVHHRRLGLGGAFRFLGSTNRPTLAIEDADVVVSTSISEGLPIALLEAMAQGRPVVATAVGGVAESVHGCGFIAPPGDVHRLADGVVSLMRRPELASLLGRRAHRRVEANYSQEQFLDRYHDLLHTLAASRPAARADEPHEDAA